VPSDAPFRATVPVFTLRGFTLASSKARSSKTKFFEIAMNDDGTNILITCTFQLKVPLHPPAKGKSNRTPPFTILLREFGDTETETVAVKTAPFSER